jgi:Flp pilus assembly protein TadD
MSKKKGSKQTLNSKTENNTVSQNEKKKTGSAPVSTELNKGKNAFNYWLFLIPAIICLFTYIAYQPALDNDFVDWDDNTYVIDNPMVRNKNVPVSEIFKQPVSLNYHPITMLTMRWNNNECKECIHGISAKPFISWNLFFHLLNTVLVFFLTYRLSLKNLFVGGFSAIVFALHPMHVESVAWVSERKDVLYVFFFLAGLLSFDKYLDGKYSTKPVSDYKWLGLTLLLFILSCLSKAMAVVFPLTLILMDFWRNPEQRPVTALKKLFEPKKLAEFTPFFLVALFFGMMAINVQSGGDFGGFVNKVGQEKAINAFDTFTLLQRFQFAAYGFCMYIFKFFVPTNLCTFHPYPTQIEYDNSTIYWGLFVLSILIFAIAAISLRSSKLFLFGIGFYFITVAFVLQFISVGVVIMADRYSYLPYVGLAFMLAMAIEKFLPDSIKKGIYFLYAVVAIVWFMQTRTQVDTWQNSDTLWGTVLKIYPNQEQPHSIRGNFYGKMASYYEARKDVKKQQEYMDKAYKDFEKAISLKSARPDVYEGMGNIHGMRRENEKALQMYSKAIELNPNKASVYINRGIARSMLGQKEASLQDMSKAYELEPKTTHLLYRGIAKQTVGDLNGAKADFQEILKREPGNKAAEDQLKLIK